MAANPIPQVPARPKPFSTAEFLGFPSDLPTSVDLGEDFTRPRVMPFDSRPPAFTYRRNVPQPKLTMEPSERIMTAALQQTPKPSNAPARFDLSGEIVKVIVGSPNTKEVSAHTSILTRSSKFFAAALNPQSGFAEAQKGVVELPEVMPEVFLHWLQWVYSSGFDLRWNDGEDKKQPPTAVPASRGPPTKPHDLTLESLMAKAGHPAAVESGARESSNPSRATADGNTPPTYSKIPDFSSQRSAPRFYPYVRLFQVAEYLGSEACQNAIIDHVRVQARKHNAVPGVQDVRRLWGDEEDAFEMKGFGEHAVHQGGLKGLTLDLYCALPTEKLVLTEEEIWPPRFMRELFARLKKGQNDQRDLSLPTESPSFCCSAYHTHRDTPACFPPLHVEPSAHKH